MPESSDSNIVQGALIRKSTLVYDRINKYLVVLGIRNYYAGGGCFADTVNDYDIFPVKQLPFDKPIHLPKGYTLIYQGANAMTLEVDGIRIQLCSFTQASLKELVESFDFVHCQIGMHVQDCRLYQGYCSDAYLEYRITGISGYTESEYPLSSLFRLFKYHDRGVLTGRAWRTSVVRILNNIIRRGFHSYADFKAQMDAVDLHYTEDDFEHADLMELLDLLGNKNNNNNE